MSGPSPTGDTTPQPPSPPPPRRTSQDNTSINMLPLTIPYELRNAEAVHNALLHESKTFHDNLRKRAEDILANHLLIEQLKAIKIEGEQKAAKAKLEADILVQETKRIKEETALLIKEAEKNEAAVKKREADIRAREAENAARSMVLVPPRSATPPAPAANPISQVNAAQQPPKPNASQPTTQAPANLVQAQSTTSSNPFAAVKPSPTPGLFAKGPSPPVTQVATPTPNNAQATQPTPTPINATQQAPNVAPQGSVPAGRITDIVDLPETQRYIDIHQQLKVLRNQVKPKGKQNTSPLKAEAMNKSSAIRIALGQLNAGNKNGAIFVRLRQIMLEAMAFRVNVGNGPEVLCLDPSPYVLHVPQPHADPATKNNGPQLPVLFIYLLSVFAKALVAQAAQEAAQKSETAEPIALAAHQIFSHPDLLWRGMSLIDVLVAKLRRSCGTLFGFRGTENLESGRVTLGWKKEDGHWISEAVHYDRMRGIGAFYAGLTLRQYKNRVNPYPPHHYWRAMAAILTCPQEERSNTSYYVLCALVQGYEQKFLHFYGDMARYALEAALVHYPRGAQDKNSAVMTLLTLGEKIEKEGLRLAAQF